MKELFSPDPATTTQPDTSLLAPQSGSDPLQNGVFQWPARVYWEDTDAGGVVYHANYLKFFERSRSEWLRSLGIEQKSLRDTTGGVFVVTDAELRYHRPACLDDELIVTARTVKAGQATLVIAHQALRKPAQAGSGPAALLCEGTIRMGWVEGASLRPGRIPASILARLKNR